MKRHQRFVLHAVWKPPDDWTSEENLIQHVDEHRDQGWEMRVTEAGRREMAEEVA